ncbi:hypothetical protein GUJ93_ZPchr0006g43556 [Zizania palustris]|uniref:Alcohol dehydrogenase-like N-terminal domain-containing protein n=1 Tax=Zizania palustris TaxID=103762 RepID=A0A8J5VW12_ZIZPA|nr:hypothetical protein GUJ93_ZPchr0006g43556 [Zizania palustris]KAG8073786.1 hypothetical protein GUJ93_ZPchr0006g43556 [Zizania palustris]
MEDQSSKPMPIRCKAAVCRAAGEPLALEEIVVDSPKAHEVRIKIICTSLCHSDVTFWRMEDFPGVFPRIFGHEAFGVVESVGEHVEGFAAGDAVVPTFLGQCSECVDCGSERSNVCSRYKFAVEPGMPRDGTTRFHDSHGAPLHNFLGVSSFCEYTVVDTNQVVRVDPAMPPSAACLLSCGATTGVGAAWKLAKVEPGSTVAIFGLGAVGLAVIFDYPEYIIEMISGNFRVRIINSENLACQVAEGARICGASMIIGVDLNPEKHELGKRFCLSLT